MRNVQALHNFCGFNTSFYQFKYFFVCYTFLFIYLLILHSFVNSSFILHVLLLTSQAIKLYPFHFPRCESLFIFDCIMNIRVFNNSSPLPFSLSLPRSLLLVSPPLPSPCLPPPLVPPSPQLELDTYLTPLLSYIV